MKLAVLFSGGKDSTYAAYLASKEHNIVCLLSMIAKNPESYMFHTPNIHLTKIQAEVMNIPLLTQSTDGEKEIELNELKQLIKKAKKKFKIQGVVTGAIKSTYQATRIQKICAELKLWCFNPLWQAEEISHLKEIVNTGFIVIITQIAAEGFDDSWLGKEIHKEEIKKLKRLHKKYKINIAFEGGEAETLVLDGPIFKKKIKIKKSRKILEKEHTGIFEIQEVELN